MIHREALATRAMDKELCDVLSAAVKVVNFIKTQPTKPWLFAAICATMGAEHLALLMHTDVRWLSRGKALQRDSGTR